MSIEDHNARAARKSAAWKAEQAEIEAAAREDAEYARRRRAVRDQERAQNYSQNVWRNLVFALLAGAVGLLFFEQQDINDRAGKCFAPMTPGQYHCADRIAGSPWFWMLPKDTKELILVAKSDGR